MLEVPVRDLPLEIWIPANVISEDDHPIVTALRCAQLARAATIFRVNRILIYPDEISKSSFRCQSLMSKHLRYLALPQYLRRHVFPRDASLKYVGVMPPLRAPSHSVPRKLSECKPGDLRIGILVKHGNSLVLEAGLERPLAVQGTVARPGEVVLTRILDPERAMCEIINKEHVKIYLNYEVTTSRKRLGELLSKRTDPCLKVGTSRLGVSVFDVEGDLMAKVRTSKHILVVFGSPKEGLHQILAKEGYRCDDLFDFILNTTPLQGVVTIRTEEAVMISLAVLNKILP
jgi:predicted SPOUT superfamily RNA methylase MTH1